MPHKVDIVIVGGGIAGLSACYFLVRLGYSVCVIEQHTIGHGATWAAAGMLAPINELDFTELELLRMGRQSLQLYDDWENELGDIGMNRSGTLEVALTPDDVPYLKRLHEFQLKQNLPVQWVDAKELKNIEPHLSATLAGGIFAPNDIQVDNRVLPAALATYCKAKKALIHENETYIAHDVNTDGIVVRTSKTEYTCKQLLFATGVAEIQQTENIPEIIPVKGQMLSVAPPVYDFISKTIRIRSRALGNAYIVPKKNRIVLGSTTEEMGTDSHLTAGGVLDILRKCYAAVPGIYDLPILETWVGHRPATHNRLPFALKAKNQEVYFVNGMFRHGILLAPIMGFVITELMVKRTLPNDLAFINAH